jgi:hypothetical protein
MDIDLNLTNYTIGDLENFFGVVGNYTIQDVEQKKQFLINRLGAMNVPQSMQNEIISFLNNAKEKLLNNSELIPKQVTPFVYSNPSDYFKGSFNPIEKRLVTKLVCVDTFFRSSYSTTKSTDFTYTFPETVNNVVSLQLASIEIPYTWYSISAEQKNNFFVIIDDSGSHVITIKDGNYTLNTLLSAIDVQLTAFSFKIYIAGEGTIAMETYPTTPCSPYSSPQFFLYIENTIGNLFTLDFSTPGPISLGWILGYRNILYIPDNIIQYDAQGVGYSGETIPMMSTNNYLFIDVDDFHNHHSTDSVISIVRNQQSTPSYIGNNIMARLPITAGYGSLITTTHNIDYISKKREYFGPIKLEKMNIRVLNRFGEVINLNQNDYSMVFEITQLYS